MRNGPLGKSSPTGSEQVASKRTHLFAGSASAAAAPYPVLRGESTASEGEVGPALGTPSRALDETPFVRRHDAVELESARPSAAVLYPAEIARGRGVSGWGGNRPDSCLWRAGPSRCSPATAADRPSLQDGYGPSPCGPLPLAARRIQASGHFQAVRTPGSAATHWRFGPALGSAPGARARARFPGPSRRLLSN